ncbi:cell wall-binding repeat-containing protein [Pseudalkalibacillus hwajinpoensis]|uniref:cell wall-binding repeat-containing protein n=1 Tax=Guptibacillus hwajinpoensis TaxID=208199 RepID=UPI00325B9997
MIKVKLLAAILLSVCLFFIMNNHVLAAPANDVFRTMKQPNGITFRSKAVGDEFRHWVETENGNVILQGEDKYWYFAKVEGSKLIATTSKVGIDSVPKNAAVKDHMDSVLPKVNRAALTPNLNAGDFKSNSATNEALIVLLVSFNDTKAKYSENEWSNKIFSSTGNSLNTFYAENSAETFQFTPATETSGVSNGIVSVKLNYNHPDPVDKYNEDQLYRQIVANALKASDGMVNYHQYDENGDGYISVDELHIVTIVAGGEGSYNDPSPRVWGHKYGLFSEAPTLDGVSVGNIYYNGGYTQFGEMHGDHMATIGIIAHELGHDLGLPDLYDRDGSSLGIDVHSVMAGGSWAYQNGEDVGQTPTHFDPWSKIQLGFVTPEIVSSSKKVNINSIKNDNYNVIQIQTDDPSEYFLIENRQYDGYDRGLENRTVSGGVAMWHIDEDQVWEGNDDEGHKLVDLEEASERNGSDLDLYKFYVDYNHYYRKGYEMVFNSETTPNSKLYNGIKTKVAIEVNDYSSDTMGVSINLGDGRDIKDPIWPANTTFKATEVGTDSLKLSWSPATDESGISNYYIYQGSQLVKTLSGDIRSTEISNLKANTSYTFKIEAADPTGNRSVGPSLTIKTKYDSILRLEGKDRFDTAVEVSRHTYQTSETVVIAKGLDFPDALAGAPLAYKLKSPILLSGKISLSSESVKEIDRLGARKAIILGGTSAVPESVKDQLDEMGLTVERISGGDRFETAAKIAAKLGSYNQAIIAYGMDFPDALSIAPYASENGYPILLTKTAELPAATGNALKGTNKNIVIGGTSVISNKVSNNIPNPTRYAGLNRYGTAAAIVKGLYTNYDTAYVASGANYPDALTGSVAAAHKSSPLYLVKKDVIPDETNNLIQNDNANSYVILGGNAAISEVVENQIANGK